jgi:hypothetical protein
MLWAALCLLLAVPPAAPAQEPAAEPDTVKVVIGDRAALDTLSTDTAKVIEDAPLDIAQDRGLFLLTPDRRLQLRILGSVRYLVVFDNIDLDNKNGFNTFDIPTGNAREVLPNYFNGLEQTRLGFEITRRTAMGDIFVRLETDFAGAGGYRIRHAYGQFRRLLLGQTWSLFSQVNTRPPTVSTGGPTGSISRRTPQARFTFDQLVRGARVSFATEYSTPEFRFPDSLPIEAFQLIPDLTARAEKRFAWGNAQVSAILPILSARTANDELVLRPGWGVSLGATVDSWAEGTWYVQWAGGRAISRFFNDLGGQGLDVLLNPEDLSSVLPFVFGAYLAYRHDWGEKFFSTAIFSILQVENEPFTPADSYRQGRSLRFNTFWDIVEGARIGAETTFGRRMDKGGEKGRAFRVSLLFYYDF